MPPGKLLNYYSGVLHTRELIKKTHKLSQEEKNKIITYGYGHLGDGDIHINLVVPGDDKELHERLNKLVQPSVMEWVRQSNGSVGAEHGVGVYNRPYLSFSKN